MKKKLLIVANPKAGKIKKEKFKDFLFKAFKDVYYPEIYFSKEKGDVKNIIEKEYENYEIFSVFGGDGTVNEAGRALLFKEKPLGIIPGGSGNGLARGLSIKGIKNAIDYIKNGKVVSIDAGKINDDYFFNISGIGLDALIAKDFNDKPLGRGIPPYVFYSFLNYIKMRPFLVEIEEDGEIIFKTDKAILVSFSNFKEWGGNTYIAPNASPFDGFLELCTIEEFNLLYGIINLPKLFNKKIDKFRYYRNFRVKKIIVKTKEEQIYHYDGEKGKYSRTFFIESFKDALKVFVKSDFQY